MFEAVYLALGLHTCVSFSLSRLEAPEDRSLYVYAHDFANSGAVN